MTRHPGLLSTALHGANLGLKLLFMLAVLRLASPELLGEYATLVGIEVVAVYCAGLEFHAFTTRRYARRPTTAKLRLFASSHSRLLLILAPLAGLVGVAAAHLLGVPLGRLEATCLLLLIASSCVSQEVSRYLVICDRPLSSVTVVFIRGAAWQPVLIPFLHPASNLTELLLFWSTASIIGTAWGLWLLRDARGFRGRIRWRYLAEGIRRSQSYYLIATASVMQANLERFALQSFLGPRAVAVFTFFQTIANTLPALVQTAVLNICLPRILNAFGQRETDRMLVLRNAVGQALKVSLALSLLLLASAFPLTLITSHREYLDGIAWLVPLLAGQVVAMWTQPYHLALYGAHRDRELVRLYSASIVVATVSCLSLVSSLGLGGAVASSTLTLALIAIGRMRLFRRTQTSNLI